MTCLSVPIHIAVGLASVAAATPAALRAQQVPVEETSQPTLSVELNGAEVVDGGCRLTFFVENGLGGDLGVLSLETAVLGLDRQVEQLTLFDFGELPAGRPRVRQFDLPDLACEAIGVVLINGVAACEGPGVEPGACQSALGLSSRTDIGLLG